MSFGDCLGETLVLWSYFSEDECQVPKKDILGHGRCTSQGGRECIIFFVIAMFLK